MEKNGCFTLYCEDVPGDASGASVSYKQLCEDVRPGDTILLDDGFIALRAEEVLQASVRCTVLNSGDISDRKGINLPGGKVNLPAMGAQDARDIRFGIENEFDFIAASFVRKAADVHEIRRFLSQHGGDGILIIAKIENQEGVDNSDEIIRSADGIMVARGDLGVEIPIERVPAVQKQLIQKCYEQAKPVITATQMLDSMMQHPRPTRAEVTDVANAVYDGTSCLMLSGETAVGRYPVESLQMMTRVALTTESSIAYWQRFSSANIKIKTITNAVSHAACMTAMDIGASAIATVTHSGRTARMLSRFRPDCPIVATTTNERVWRQLGMSWGVSPFLVDEVTSTDEMFELSVRVSMEGGFASDGDIIVITSGVPVGMSGTTNLIKVHTVGNILLRATGIGLGHVVGDVVVARSLEELSGFDTKDSILVLPDISHDMMPAIRQAAALIVEGGEDGHAAAVGLALNIPVLIGADSALRRLKTGMVVSVDAARGIVSSENL